MRRHRDFVQDSIDSIPDAQVVFQRLDVNISGALRNRFADDLVNEFHHGRLRIIRIQLNGGLGVLQRIHRTSRLQNLVESFCANAIEGLHCPQQLRPWHQHPFSWFFQELPCKLSSDRIEKIISRQHDRIFLYLDWQNVMLKHETARQD